MLRFPSMQFLECLKPEATFIADGIHLRNHLPMACLRKREQSTYVVISYELNYNKYLKKLKAMK